MGQKSCSTCKATEAGYKETEDNLCSAPAAVASKSKEGEEQSLATQFGVVNRLHFVPVQVTA